MRFVVVNAKMNPELTFCAGFRASCAHELKDEAKAFRNFWRRKEKTAAEDDEEVEVSKLIL